MIRNTLIAVYIIAVLAISAVARAEVVAGVPDLTANEIGNFNFQKHTGEIVATANGSLVLVVNGGETIFALQSHFDLTPFIGTKVMINGIELEYQLAPVYEIESVDPLPGFESGKRQVVFFVFGISEVTE